MPGKHMGILPTKIRLRVLTRFKALSWCGAYKLSHLIKKRDRGEINGVSGRVARPCSLKDLNYRRNCHYPTFGSPNGGSKKISREGGNFGIPYKRARVFFISFFLYSFLLLIFFSYKEGCGGNFSFLLLFFSAVFATPQPYTQ